MHNSIPVYASLEDVRDRHAKPIGWASESTDALRTIHDWQSLCHSSFDLLVLSAQLLTHDREDCWIPDCHVEISIAGHHGHPDESDAALLQLIFHGEDRLWQLRALDKTANDGIPSTEWHLADITFDLWRGDKLSLIQSDAPAILDALGDDLPRLLTAIASGHSTTRESDHNFGSPTGKLTKAAQAASNHLDRLCNHGLIQYVLESDIPATIPITDWLTEPIADTDTAQSILETAATERVRIWGGLPSVQNFLDTHPR